MPAEPANRGSDASRIDHEASEWFIELQSGPLSPAQRRRFERWLAADRRHASAFEETTSCWAELGSMTHWASAEPTEDSTRASWGGAVLGRLGLGLEKVRLQIAVPAIALAALATFLVVRVTSEIAQTSESYATRVAEIREIVLTDGSIVTLGARSAMDVEFTSRERRILLTSGEAFFEVEKDPERPFFVSAGDTFVRAVGTKFNVHSNSRKVRVAVLEGVVEVSRAAADDAVRAMPEKRKLEAGQEVVSIHDGALGQVRASAGSGDAWRTGRLVYENASLDDIIADVNRYYDGEVEFDYASLGQLRVTASFDARDIDKMIDTLVLGFPIEVARPAPQHIVLRPRPNRPS